MRLLALLLSVGLLTAGCGLSPSPLQDDEDVLAPPAGCPAERYLFAGRETLRDLGLVEHSLDRLPQPERSAMIWVTEGRMLCFEFDDSSGGGGGYTIDDAWVPPRGIQNDEATAGVPMQVIGIMAVAVAILVLSVLAFRRAK